jgi:hypothetical protein
LTARPSAVALRPDHEARIRVLRRMECPRGTPLWFVVDWVIELGLRQVEAKGSGGADGDDGS